MKNPRIGQFVRLRYVRGERGVTRAMNGGYASVLSVWHYAGGLERLKVQIEDSCRVVWISPQQIEDAGDRPQRMPGSASFSRAN